MERRIRRAQNYLIIWVDENIDLDKEDFQNSMTKLRSIVIYVKTCTELADCIEYLKTLDDCKAFIISSGTLGQKLVVEVHDMPMVDAIYIFCGNRSRHRQWASEWPKIQGVYTSIKPICESLKKVAYESDHNDIPMSFLPKTSIASFSGSSKENLDRLPRSYMFFVIFKEIILEIDDEPEQQINALVTYFHENEVLELEIVDFQKRYYQKSALWWYTYKIFFNGMLNQALRALDMKGIIKMGFFIRHLHLQLEKLHEQQSDDFKEKLIVFRGQGFNQEHLQKLCESKDGLISFNSFLSTSKKREIAMQFVHYTMMKSSDCIGVLFIMTIDTKKISTIKTPFACINGEIATVDKEQEILFTIHTVFRVVDIGKMQENSRLYEVQLVMTDDNDPQMAALNDYIKKNVRGSLGWRRVGDLMLQLGDFDQAEELYSHLLVQTTRDKEKAFIYHQLGSVKGVKSEYQEAIRFYELSLKIELKTVRKDDISLTPIYNNIALAYNNLGDCLKALEFYEKSHQILVNALPSNHPNLAASYNNIGQVFNNMGDYSKALKFYEKSLKIKEEVLPENHPSLAISYNNIGQVYKNMVNYSKALEFFEKSLKIKEKALPSNHPSLATSYSNIGLVYMSMNNDSKSLEYLEKALCIRQKSLPPGHPLIQNSINDIATVKNKM